MIAAVLKIAQADRSIARTSDIWDADPWLLEHPGRNGGSPDRVAVAARSRRALHEDHGRRAGVSSGCRPPALDAVPPRDHRRRRRAPGLSATRDRLLPDRIRPRARAVLRVTAPAATARACS